MRPTDSRPAMRQSATVKPALVALAATAVLVVVSVVQAGNDFVIVVGGPREQQRIGPYSFAKDPGYAAAVRALGQPTSRGADAQVSACTVRWTRLGLELRFASIAPDPCSPASLSQSAWSGATVYARAWRTNKGLRLGDSVARLRSLYPKARYRDRPPAPPSWLLVFRAGEVGLTVYLQAYVWGGRVTALDLPPGNVSVGR